MVTDRTKLICFSFKFNAISRKNEKTIAKCVEKSTTKMVNIEASKLTDNKVLT